MKDVLQRLAALDLNLLVSLHALTKFANVTEAAAHLGVTQSTMSHQLSRLRDMFGDELLVRRGRSMALTPRAVAIAEPLGHALKAVHDVALEWRFEPSRSTATVVLAMSDWASTQYAPRLMEVLSKDAPGMRVQLVPPLVDGAIEPLDWDVDLAILSTPEPLTGGNAHFMIGERLTGVARAGHPILEGEMTVERFLATETAVVHSTTVPPGIVAEVERLAGPSRRARLFLSYFLALPEVLPRTDLISIVPSSVAWSLVVDHGLKAFPIPIPLPTYALSLAWSPLRQGDPMIEWLRSKIIAFVERELPLRAARFTVP